VCESVTAALASEIVVAAVERVKVNAAEVLRAAVAEFCRPLGAAIARGHVLVERSETASLDLFTGLGFQALMGTVLRVVTLEGSLVMRRIWMSGRSRVRVCVVGTSVMLRIGVSVALGLRFGFHVDSIGKISRRVIVYF
jgi:hypothetical protein